MRSTFLLLFAAPDEQPPLLACVAASLSYASRRAHMLMSPRRFIAPR